MPTTKDRVFIAVEVDFVLKAGLDAIKERDGIAISFQVARAIENWLQERGIPAAAKAKKGGGRTTRKK
jgi:hypothetical protein